MSARGAGCGCKLAPGLLLEALATLPEPPSDADLLVGNGALDDAAVYRLRDDLAVVATVDFFTPVVDDPATFGAIAATNALSDVYAMGGTPTLALAVAMFPADGDRDALAATLRGGAEAALAHGCPVVGGHTIDDPEPKYGLAVVGTVHPERLLTNSAGRVGDVLVLTKPIGTGTAVQAARAGGAPRELEAAIAVMLSSNRGAAEAAVEVGARCATDVTGFGFAGHLGELADASGVAAELALERVPLIDGTRALAAAGHAPSGARRNREFLASRIVTDADVPDELAALLFDPQTSGGLLISVAPGRAPELCGALTARGAGADVVGRLVDGPRGTVRVRRDLA